MASESLILDLNGQEHDGRKKDLKIRKLDKVQKKTEQKMNSEREQPRSSRKSSTPYKWDSEEMQYVLVPTMGSEIGDNARAMNLTELPPVIDLKLAENEQLVFQFGGADLNETRMQISPLANEVPELLVDANTKKRKHSKKRGRPQSKSRSATPVAGSSSSVLNNTTEAEADDEDEENSTEGNNRSREKKVAKRRVYEWTPLNSYEGTEDFAQEIAQNMLRIHQNSTNKVGTKKLYYCKECTKTAGPFILLQYHNNADSIDCYILGQEVHSHFMKEGVDYKGLLENAKTVCPSLRSNYFVTNPKSSININ
jgi:hypothetical protein